MLDKDEKKQLFDDLKFMRDGIVRLETTQEHQTARQEKQGRAIEQIRDKVSNFDPRLVMLEKNAAELRQDARQQEQNIVNTKMGLTKIVSYGGGMLGAAALAALLVKIFASFGCGV